jgi:hypothetical protein
LIVVMAWDRMRHLSYKIRHLTPAGKVVVTAMFGCLSITYVGRTVPPHYAAGNARFACHSFPLHPQLPRANRLGDIMRNIGTLGWGIALAALFAALPTAGHAYTPEEQAACQPDAFRLCGSEIPNIDRVKACMLARRAQLSPECKRYFHPDPEPVAVAPPPAYAGRPVNIRPRPAKPAKPVVAKAHSANPTSAKKPATPKARKPAKPPAAT